MRFLASIYADEGAWAALSEEERAAAYEGYMALSRDGRAAGVVLGGDELAPVSSATTVRIRDGRTAISDGPYAETKEALGGYYLLECSSWDEALEWAARIPGAAHGAVEVRQVHEDEGQGAEAVGAGTEAAA